MAYLPCGVIKLPEGKIDESPAYCLNCGGFLYWRFDENRWAHVRDIREQDKESR